jgi:hypothetical protein
VNDRERVATQIFCAMITADGVAEHEEDVGVQIQAAFEYADALLSYQRREVERLAAQARRRESELSNRGARID